MHLLKHPHRSLPLAGACLAALLAASTLPAVAQSTTPPALATGDTERVLVQVPYVELHIGPHRYYPVFFVAKQDEWITVLFSRGDFLRVRTANGQEGWVLREELESSLRAAGIDKNWRDKLMDEYITNRFTLGYGIGRLSTETRFQFWGAYQLDQNWAIEASLNKMLGRFDGTTMWQVDLVATPWPEWTVVPYAAAGVGQLRDLAQNQDGSKPTASAYEVNLRTGVSYKIGRHYGARLEGAYYQAVHVGHAAPSFDSLLNGAPNRPAPSDHRTNHFGSIMASLSYSF
jgi:hypothetical protein